MTVRSVKLKQKLVRRVAVVSAFRSYSAIHRHIICSVRCQPGPALLWSCTRRAYLALQLASFLLRCAARTFHSQFKSLVFSISPSLPACKLQVAVILSLHLRCLPLIDFSLYFLVSISSGTSPPEYMTSASTQFAPAHVRMGMYGRPPPPPPSVGIWNSEPFKVDSGQATRGSTIMEADTKFDTGLEEVPQMELEPTGDIVQEARKPRDKVMRRLAQNREAARKSRLRKKAYIQQLETSRIKLAQLEQELQRVRQQQGVYASPGSLGGSAPGLTGSSMDSGVAAFEIEYSHWVDEQNRHTGELRSALQGQTTELELQMLVETGLSNYDHLFRIKAIAASSDVFCIMSGMWKTPAERFFLWIGGFRPSEVLKILSPQLEPLTDQQFVAVCGLQQTSTQAEDALSQGMEKLQQTLAEALTATDPFGSSDAYMGMANAVDRLKSLVGFVHQADHLRQTTLQQMHKILTTRQAARGLLVLGDYFQRLRALSSLWTARTRESAIS